MFSSLHFLSNYFIVSCSLSDMAKFKFATTLEAVSSSLNVAGQLFPMEIIKNAGSNGGEEWHGAQS